MFTVSHLGECKKCTAVDDDTADDDHDDDMSEREKTF